ncbi:MAG: DUF3168 domain-containing protein [Robiginitomaculum sp.]
MSDYNQARAVAKAIHNHLSNSQEVQSLLGNPPRLYDNPPEDPIYPYLSYGRMQSSDISGDAAPLSQHIISLHIWSRYGGRGEIFDCNAAIAAALFGASLPLGEGIAVHSNITFTDNFRAPDGRTMHGLIRLSLTTQPSQI